MDTKDQSTHQSVLPTASPIPVRPLRRKKGVARLVKRPRASLTTADEAQNETDGVIDHEEKTSTGASKRRRNTIAAPSLAPTVATPIISQNLSARDPICLSDMSGSDDDGGVLLTKPTNAAHSENTETPGNDTGLTTTMSHSVGDLASKNVAPSKDMYLVPPLTVTTHNFTVSNNTNSEANIDMRWLNTVKSMPKQPSPNDSESSFWSLFNEGPRPEKYNKKLQVPVFNKEAILPGCKTIKSENTIILAPDIDSSPSRKMDVTSVASAMSLDLKVTDPVTPPCKKKRKTTDVSSPGSAEKVDGTPRPGLGGRRKRREEERIGGIRVSFMERIGFEQPMPFVAPEMGTRKKHD